MNILADRHHAGLFRSLQLLFGRVGGTIYTPVGHEWWDEGYWRFGIGYGDDRLARQYLDLGQKWVDEQNIAYGWDLDSRVGSHYETTDPEFPDVTVCGVTLEQAKAMDWAAIVCTVSDNQYGFWRFAHEKGARYVVQVGNTNQAIDWRLDPAVINNSEMPMLGRFVNIGQEFDSDGLFGYSPVGLMMASGREPRSSGSVSSRAQHAEDSAPPSCTRIGSFVNCYPEIMADHPHLRASYEGLTQGLPEFDFRIYGISGKDGNLKPISRVAEAMRACGWALHDKPQGDGFGHVLHYWAAIGRPLIGHASHYRGKSGEKYWQDLETCIDLDLHPIEEAVRLIREISSDPTRHERMCRAIRAVFDAETDWARDAAAVRDLLSL